MNEQAKTRDAAPARRRKRFYVIHHPGRGWLFSLCIGSWLFEGATWWRLRPTRGDGFGLGPFWIGRRTYA